MSDNVRAFPGNSELPENPLQMTPPRYGFCAHASIVLDDHTRSLSCSDPKCGAVLDPFDYLRQNASTLQRAWSNYRHVNAQAHEIAERVSVLKKEEQRLRAMLKRLQEKTGAVISTRGATP
jgi:cell shape-determining protein MreC